MEGYLYIPSPNKHMGRRKPIRLIVWHSTESGEVRGGAHNIAAGWFAKPESGVSCHVTVDDGTDARYPSGVIESVFPWDTAWHCGNANSDGYGVEIVGKASQSGVEWTDPYSLAAIANAAKWLKWNDQVNHIPARWLTDREVRDGFTQGHVTHEQVARVLGGSNHTDPGPHFPRDYVMGLFGVPVRVDKSDGALVPRTLKYGMMDDPDVRRMQEWGNTVFPSYWNLPTTGNYLDMTVKAVKEFQERAGVTGPDADGTIVGPRTQEAMRRYGWKARD